jgi:hypothetical protein
MIACSAPAAIAAVRAAGADVIEARAAFPCHCMSACARCAAMMATTSAKSPRASACRSRAITKDDTGSSSADARGSKSAGSVHSGGKSLGFRARARVRQRHDAQANVPRVVRLRLRPHHTQRRQQREPHARVMPHAPLDVMSSMDVGGKKERRARLRARRHGAERSARRGRPPVRMHAVGRSATCATQAQV